MLFLTKFVSPLLYPILVFVPQIKHLLNLYYKDIPK